MDIVSTMEKFIGKVRDNRCLWDPGHHWYRRGDKKDEVWASVVIDCNDSSIPNLKVAKEKWRTLRENHRVALKRAKLGRNKLLPPLITTWKYARFMQFLEPHMKHRITDEVEPKDEQKSPKSDTANDTVDDTVNRVTDPQEGEALRSFFDCIYKSTKEMPPWLQTQVKKRTFAIIIEAEEQLSRLKREQSGNDADSCSSITVIKTESFAEESCDCSM